MRVRQRGLVVLASLAAAVLAGCGSAALNAPRPEGSAPIAARIVLSEQTVLAGTPIRAVAVLTNNTGRTIPAPRCAQGDWLAVDIVIHNVGFHAPDGGIPCSSAVALKPGVTKVGFVLSTTYRVCSRSSRVPPGNEPRCPDGRRPPLPDGYYVARTTLVGLPRGVAEPAAVRIALVPSSALAVGATASFKGEAITLVKVVDPSTRGVVARFFDPAAGRRLRFAELPRRRYVSVELRVANTGTAAITGSADDAVVLLGTNNSWYLSIFRDTGSCTATACAVFGPGTYRIAPGNSQVGTVTFRVPDGVRIGAIEVRDGVLAAMTPAARGVNATTRPLHDD